MKHKLLSITGILLPIRQVQWGTLFYIGSMQACIPSRQPGFSLARFGLKIIHKSTTTLKNIADKGVKPARYIDGYNGTFNGTSVFWVVLGNRIYPPVPHLSLNIHQNLYWDISQFTEDARNWAWAKFLREDKHQNRELEERLFTAIEWYNRSTAETVDEEEVLLDLAVAFESLLDLEYTDKITTRFEETVMTLLGRVPRLDSWLNQFYDARSSVAHKGRTPHYMFYARDRERTRFPRGYSGKNATGSKYRSLASYGRRIFRLCLTAILSGARMAEDDGLSSLFVHNQERLEKICQQLSQTTEPAEDRLRSIAALVDNLHDHHWASQEQVQSKTLVDTGRLVIQTYMDTTPELSSEAETVVQDVLQKSKQKDISADEKLHLFEKVVIVLSKGQANNATSQSSLEAQRTVTIVVSLLNYVASPRFVTRWWMGQTSST